MKTYHGDTETQRTAKIARIAKIAEIENQSLGKLTTKEDGNASDHPINRSRAITRS